jgi:hypothetical protein
MAGGEGIEPPTFWFEARHSNPAELTADKLSFDCILLVFIRELGLCD